jgi:hypothetical protein
MKPLEITFHKNQLPIYRDPHRFKFLNCGRRFGKTKFCRNVGALKSLDWPESTGYVVAPFAKRAMRLYRQILKLIPKEHIANVSEKWMNFELNNGATVWCMSGENPESLPGEGLDWLAIDEAALCKEEVWHVLQPSLMDNPKSEAWVVSSPRGKNWFYEACQLEKIDPVNYKYYHYTTYDNPTIDRAEIDRMAKSLPELMFRQEIMAEFIEGGLVFRNLARMMTATIQEPIPGHTYVMGVDLAKMNDFNVIKIGDTGSNTEVFSKRDNRLDWSFQKSSIYMQAKRYNNATVIVDKTGVGEAVVEDLQKMDRAYVGAQPQGYLTVVPIMFSAVSKPELYKQYILMQENNLIWLLNDPVTKYEHESFECELMPSGYVRYSAPPNRNDDTVTAAALMAWGMGKIYPGATIIGPLTQDNLEQAKNPKKAVDPTCQIDVDQIIRGMESRQIAGFGYEADEQNIVADYDEKNQ